MDTVSPRIIIRVGTAALISLTGLMACGSGSSDDPAQVAAWCDEAEYFFFEWEAPDTSGFTLDDYDNALAEMDEVRNRMVDKAPVSIRSDVRDWFDLAGSNKQSEQERVDEAGKRVVSYARDTCDLAL